MPIYGDPVPLDLPPGVVKVESALASEGRFFDADKMRFRRGKPEKVGGWVQRTEEAVTGVPRGMHAWLDTDLSTHYAVGTSRKLYAFDASDDRNDITPDRTSGTLANPFSTVNTSTTVTVDHAAHGLAPGDEVTFSGAAAVGGITIDGTYNVVGVPANNSYTITHSSPATSTAGPGGGAAVSYVYELSIGYQDATIGLGWGAGPWGSGTWGTPRTSSSIIFEPRTWSLDNFGEILIANPINGSIYQWDPQDPPGTLATIVTNAPTMCRAIFITGERFLVALGTDGDPMQIAWASQGTLTTWSPTSTNTANVRTLSGGSKMMSGARLGNGANLLWSDSACFLMQYRGDRLVYGTRMIGEKCGLIGPMAKVVVNGIAYWMSPAGFYTSGGAAPQSLPNQSDIQDYVFDNITIAQQFKCFATYVEHFDEVWFHYPSESENEPTRYVIYSITERHWSIGTLERTSSARFETGNTRPMMAAEDGYVYDHENGVDANGAALESYLKWAPIQMAGRNFELRGLFPDFETQVGDLSILITAYDRIRGGSTDSETLTVTESEDVEDPLVSGRYMEFTITSNTIGGDWRLGRILIEVVPMGTRR